MPSTGRYPTIERMQQVRGLNGWTQEDMAARLGISPMRLRYLETGRTPISDHELSALCFLTGFPRAFFFQAPPPQFPMGSLLFQCQGYVCDPCERETGEEVEAHNHCAACGEDLCEVHVYRVGDVTRCQACHEKASK